MDQHDYKLSRLLRSAAMAQDASPAEPPFGFDTRVVALWKSQRANHAAEPWALIRMLRNVTIVAAIVAASAGAGVWWQTQQSESSDSLATAYSIADSTVEAGAIE
jgi:hypothetical protein